MYTSSTGKQLQIINYNNKLPKQQKNTVDRSILYFKKNILYFLRNNLYVSKNNLYVFRLIQPLIFKTQRKDDFRQQLLRILT